MVLYDADRANQRLGKQDTLIDALNDFYQAYWRGEPLEEFVSTIEAARKDLEVFDAGI